MIASMEFAEKVNKLLAEKGLSQRALAGLLGDVNKDSVNRWCRGSQMPDVKTALRLARVLGVSLDYLVDDQMDEPPTLGLTSEELALVEAAREMGVGTLVMPWIKDEDMEPEAYERHVLKIAKLYTKKRDELHNEATRRASEHVQRLERQIAEIGPQEFARGQPATPKPTKGRKGAS